MAGSAPRPASRDAFRAPVRHTSYSPGRSWKPSCQSIQIEHIPFGAPFCVALSIAYLHLSEHKPAAAASTCLFDKLIYNLNINRLAVFRLLQRMSVPLYLMVTHKL